jgi:pyrroloquinoline quinone (PQQ) biosynthesis protein C
MKFFEKLQKETEQERNYLYAAPIISQCFNDSITVEDYVAFLLQAYEHVKHTTPLLMAAGSRIPSEKEWVRAALAEYIEEELGHQEWILNDIAACGFDKEKARNATPNMETELMISYAYDTIQRKNPLTFFGMVHVLEGTSISTADLAADSIQTKLNLPNKAFSYLRSHGALDQEHVKFFESIMNRIDNPEEQKEIIHAAKVFYHLYGNVFRSIKPEQAIALAA